MLRFPSLSASLVALAMLWPCAAGAHAVWIAQRTGELAIVYGHGAADDPYDPTRVKSVNGYTSDGSPKTVKTVARENRVHVKPENGTALISVFFGNGFWTEGADGEWHNVGKSKIADARSAGNYVKHVLSVIAPQPEGAKPTGLQLEIVPLKDPLPVKAGQELPLRVLFNRSPLKGAVLIPDYANDPDAKGPVTNVEGEARVVVRNNGLNAIALSHDKKLAGDPDAYVRGHLASLSFMLLDPEE